MKAPEIRGRRSETGESRRAEERKSGERSVVESPRSKLGPTAKGCRIMILQSHLLIQAVVVGSEIYIALFNILEYIPKKSILF